ncbi:Riboflavin biosynthesis protein RibD [Rhodobacteraceae bacterium THAF1]|uniref:bifunctional diaminohydroxyphosphoribosylaminopyrimidine deaminase/5-amino-6-(5-phosphoribosylamino)uracil reductase RibD n=1 Tax=Palleronia sp. THAF1 TaxID=2587842 RepID=UPI000F3CD317|nr:bifunctional diaminohydroxyphosphoribosylaminopyrimidine deaminase/5-amino-6-(5-phosphoribosylamino)uracil reductase RibD [Palleronia sp. THAF1]QFU08004.1 Riboflavin biosynthesis protein RibD [Palleronia sp. THAF1]VDC27857.1 Riboflavin biosynthesis protein RibD [Rhodobacteraceae bacterium THAF1]
MAHALALGRRGQGATWPNPAVGCVITRDGRVVGRGWTQPGGRPHAEVVAIAQAGSAARGATAYVSLEPCAHHGRTPPCAEALIAAGVVRVVTALEDPDPRVAGRGHAMLRAAGVEVVEGVGSAEAGHDQIGFLTRVTRNRPMVTLKLATSLDGRIATASGESQWITGPDARRAVHGMRLTHDAVLVGGGTARADDPRLTVRDFGPVRQPIRIIAARKLDLPMDGALWVSVPDAPLWLLHGSEADPTRIAAWTEQGARCIPIPVIKGHLDPASMLATLGEEGMTRIFCEGGGSLAGSLMHADLVDRLVTFQAGVMLGAEGQPAIAALGIDALNQAQRFELHDTRRIGADIVSHWSRRP